MSEPTVVITRTHATWNGGMLFDAGNDDRVHKIDGNSKEAPSPVETLLPTVKVAEGVGWSQGQKPSAAQGLQVQAARRFLRQHEDELRRLGSFDGVEEVCLDFTILRRAGAAQSDVFPADLLWQAGALDIDLVVTHHDAADDGPPSASDV